MVSRMTCRNFPADCYTTLLQGRQRDGQYVVTSSQRDNVHEKDALRTGMTDCRYVGADIPNTIHFGINPLNAELNPICHLLALLRVHHFLHVSRIRVKSLTLRLLMSYIYIYTHTHTHMEHLFLMFLDHTQRRSTVGRTPLDE